MEYDAYRCDLEELNLGPRDATSRAKLEQAEVDVRSQRERYLKSRDDLATKLRLLDENKVRRWTGWTGGVTVVAGVCRVVSACFGGLFYSNQPSEPAS